MKNINPYLWPLYKERNKNSQIIGLWSQDSFRIEVKESLALISSSKSGKESINLGKWQNQESNPLWLYNSI